MWEDAFGQGFSVLHLHDLIWSGLKYPSILNVIWLFRMAANRSKQKVANSENETLFALVGVSGHKIAFTSPLSFLGYSILVIVFLHNGTTIPQETNHRFNKWTWELHTHKRSENLRVSSLLTIEVLISASPSLRTCEVVRTSLFWKVLTISIATPSHSSLPSKICHQLFHLKYSS